MNLARRLAPIFKHSDAMTQEWGFVNQTGSNWSILDAGKTALLNSGQVMTWNTVATTAPMRNAKNGNYYYEVYVSKHMTGDSQALRIGIGNKNIGDWYFAPRGDVVVLGGWTKYMDSTLGNDNVYKWGAGDTIGCSMKLSGTRAELRFYVNGVDVSYNQMPIIINELYDLEIQILGFRLYASHIIEVQNNGLKYLPAGFEPW